jgi:hypothetical protein
VSLRRLEALLDDARSLVRAAPVVMSQWPPLHEAELLVVVLGEHNQPISTYDGDDGAGR